jgi:uncharacterized protein YndB with AHSA1/START domain
MQTANKETSEQVVRLSRTFKATPERVFAAWSTPEQIAKWFGPANYTVRVLRLEAGIDGEYEFAMTPPGADQARFIAGRYLDYQPGRRLVFTWAWRDEPGAATAADESLVTVEFNASGADTELVLTHERLTGAESREGHRQGWVGSFDGLDEYLS